MKVSFFVGVVLVAVPVAALFIGTALAMGWLFASLIWLLALAIAVVMTVGVFLMAGGARR